MKVFQCEVGRAICRFMRDMLESEKFSGRKIEWIESKGLISRVFTIKGDDADVELVKQRVQHWFDCMNQGTIK